ncbi:MAG TPA: LUD domain-containing protein [Bryobacteraceae bacterium]|nr:LUD domain-containing protein [Bryobacteraceae bacterium]
MNNAKNDILNRIRATGGSTPLREIEYEAIARNYRRTSSLDASECLELFVELLQDYGATVYRCGERNIPDAVAQALMARGKTSALIARDLPRAWLPDGFQFLRETQNYAEFDASEGVLTDCALAIASTGTIVLRHGAGEARRALSLIPDYHLCVVFAAQVFGTVPEGLNQMRTFGNVPMTTISGPSATADIEMTRIKGVHGPRTFDIILVG